MIRQTRLREGESGGKISKDLDTGEPWTMSQSVGGIWKLKIPCLGQWTQFL
jgi:hypothetical protein